MIHLIADERHACAHAHGELTVGSRGIPVQVGLSDDFDGLAVTICFQAGTERAEVVWYEGEEINVPPQCLTKEGERLLVGVYGAKADGTVVIPTIWATAGIVKRGTDLTGASPLDPEPDWTAQVQFIAAEAIETANAVKAAADAGEFDGYSPSASVTKSGDTATITITDKDGTTTASIRDGYDTSGSVVQDGTTAIITLTDHDGTTKAEVHDGISPSASVAQTETGATVTITDRSGTTTAQIANGATGPRGERGPQGPKGDTGDGATRIEYGSGIILVQCDSDGRTKAYGGGFDVRAFVGAERQACTAAINYGTVPSWLTISVTNNASGTPVVRYSWQQGQAASNAYVTMGVTTTDVSGAEVTYPCTLNVTTVRDGAAGAAGEDGYGFVPVDGTFVPIHTNPDNTTRAGQLGLKFEPYRGNEELAITGMTFLGPSWITATQSTIDQGLLVLTWPDGETLVDSVGCSLTVTIDDHGTTRYEHSEIVVGAVKDGADGISPTVTVAPITGGHEVTVTDAGGSQSFDVMDGKDGQKLTKTLSGTLLTAEDAYAAPPVDATVYGASTQVTTTGKNLLSDVAEDWVTSSITGANRRTLFIKAENGASYHYHRNAAKSLGIVACWYNESDGTTSGLGTWTNYYDRDMTNDDDWTHLVLAIAPSVFSVDDLRLTNAQVEKGTAFTSYESYSGGIASPSPDWMQPIESVDELTYWNTGKQLMDWAHPLRTGSYNYDISVGTTIAQASTDKVSVSIDGSNLVMVVGAAWCGAIWRSPNLPNGTYHVCLPTATASDASGTSTGSTLFVVDKENVVVRKINTYASTGGWDNTVTLSGDEAAICVNAGTRSGTTGTYTYATATLEVGSTATAYEPYVGSSTPIDLQSHELRSLPDGTRDELNLTYIGNGLTEGYGLYHAELVQQVGSVDMGTLAWTKNASNGYFTATISDMYSTTTERLTGLMCPNYAISPTSGLNTTSPADKTMMRYATSFVVRDSTYTDAATFKAAVSGVTLDYQLAEPVTHDLGTVTLPANPAPDMTAWADGGSAQPSLSLTYERDINIVLADMQSEVEHVWAQIAPVEQPIATANHAVGTYLVLGGTFCKVTTAIAIGETVAIGTNVAATTVAAELLAIQA